MISKNCRQCGTEFTVADDDLAFYDKVSLVFNGLKYAIPEPTLCPDCRRQRRLVTRNESKLYYRKCDLCKTQGISGYSTDKDAVVYCPKCWFSDDWDQFSYGQSFDFKRPFFDQFAELLKKSPRPSIHVVNNENCDYVNQCGYSKDCYISFNTDFSQNCSYCKNVYKSRDCMNLLKCENCELCYDSLLLNDCYKVIGSLNCKNCHNVYFSSNLIGCSDCFGCMNLRNKQYCFMNEQLTQEEYFKRLNAIDLGDSSTYEKMKKSCEQFFLQFPHRYAEIINSENATGEWLVHCKNTLSSFDCVNSRDLLYCTVQSDARDSCDCDIGGYNSELCFETVSAGHYNYHCLLSANLWGNNSEVFYSHILIGCSHVFGCTSMRNQKYCILNKQYAKEEYMELIPKIIEHMKSTGEWGEFFPMSIWPYGYNETIANDYYPLTQEEAVSRNLYWHQDDSFNKSQGPNASPPDNIQDVSHDHQKVIFTCHDCGKNYRVTLQEIDFAKKIHIPLSKKCFHCRFQDLFRKRNPRVLHDRVCGQCGVAFQTTYAPDRPEKVYCEKCYLEAVY